MPGRIRLVFRHVGSPPTGAEFAALLDDVEAAFRVAFWIVRPDAVAEARAAPVAWAELAQRTWVRQDWVFGKSQPWVALPPAPRSPEFELQAESLSFRSPFEFLGTVQGIVGGAGLSGTLYLFVKNVEYILDAPDRIRLRRIRRQRERYQELALRERAARAYLEARRQPGRRFELDEGDVEIDENEDG